MYSKLFVKYKKSWQKKARLPAIWICDSGMIRGPNLLGFPNPRWFKWQTYLDCRIQDDSDCKPTWIVKSKMIQNANLFGFQNPRWFRRQTYLDFRIQDDSERKPTWISESKMIQTANLRGLSNPRWFKHKKTRPHHRDLVERSIRLIIFLLF